jgi:hypothetical protein
MRCDNELGSIQDDDKQREWEAPEQERVIRWRDLRVYFRGGERSVCCSK